MTTQTLCEKLIVCLFVSSALLGALRAEAEKTPASWNPAVTERLVKLPQNHLKKSIDRDFARSALADAISKNDGEIKLKIDTLGDLGKAAEQAQGNLRIELRHQLLAEKRSYLNLVQRRQELRRQHLEKRKRVYGRILKKVLRDAGTSDLKTRQLVRQQQEAQTRFENSSQAVDIKLFATFDAPDTQYAREYARNLSAANALLQAINSHPVHKQNEPDRPKNKATYLRRLVSETESEIALITQEDEILGYMAKLVALDATALSQWVNTGAETETATTETGTSSPLIPALNYFIQ